MKGFLPEVIEQSLVEEYRKTGVKLVIDNFAYVSGGCINSAAVLDTNQGKRFIKWNDRRRYPDMFQAEAKGLRLLREPGFVHVPEPYIAADAGNFSYLVTEYVLSSARSADYWEKLGVGLASLHRISHSHWGLNHDNYIGSLPQVNEYGNSWTKFYIDQRLQSQLKLAVNHGKMGSSHVEKFGRLYTRIEELLGDDEPPALLHGDLWGGNLMTGPDGEPVIFDPAVYFGHREIDLAMTRLFGGFSSTFYASYNEAYPLKPGVEDRLDLYQLYPLMVHVNLFGGGYISQVEYILNRFI